MTTKLKAMLPVSIHTYGCSELPFTSTYPPGEPVTFIKANRGQYVQGNGLGGQWKVLIYCGIVTWRFCAKYCANHTPPSLHRMAVLAQKAVISPVSNDLRRYFIVYLGALASRP